MRGAFSKFLRSSLSLAVPAATLLAASPALANEPAKGGAMANSGFVAAAKVLLEHGGAFPYLNLIVLGISVALIIERFIALFRYDINAQRFMDAIEGFIRKDRIDSAKNACAAEPNKALPQVLLAGLKRANRGEAEVSAAIEEAMMDWTPKVTTRTPMLFPLANIATLFGLIGTIAGLIRSFGALATAAPDQKSQLLSLGISEAMYNTAFGLLIAVSCLATQLFLANKAKGMVEEMELCAVRLENLLNRRAAGDLDEGAPKA